MYICKNCDKGFEYNSQLKQHLQRGCKNNEIFKEDIKHECPLCGKTYKRKGHYKNHIETCKNKFKNTDKVQNIINCKKITNIELNNTIVNLSGYTKKIIAANQNWKCNLCNLLLPAGYEVDHIIQKSKGGSNKLCNLQALCPNCHSEKTFTEGMICL